MSNGFHDRDEAYRLQGADAHRKFYDDWADSYDEEFAEAVNYCYPSVVAECFGRHSTPSDSPVADLGCGTGLVGMSLRRTGVDLDGFDISTGMLAQAARKKVYRNLHIADFTRCEGLPRNCYGGLISCGSFTLGHLGPEALANAVDMARPTALCVIGINCLHFDQENYAAFFEDMCRCGRINSLTVELGPIYAGDGYADQDPMNIAKIAVFRTGDIGSGTRTMLAR